MKAKKPSINFLQNKKEKESRTLLETRVELVKNKIGKNKNQTHGMKKDFKRTEIEKFEKMIFELNKKLAILGDSKDELQNRLDIDNQKLPNIQQNIRDIRKYGEAKLSTSTISINKTMKLI